MSDASVEIDSSKPRFRVRAGSLDGLQNLAQGLGNPLKDKLAGSSYSLFALNPQSVTDTYFGSWLARRIVDIPAEDMTTKAPEITLTGGDDDTAKDLTDAVTKRILEPFCRGLRWGRLYGGAAAIIVTRRNGATEALDTPYDPLKVEKDGFAQLLITDRWAISKDYQRITDPGDPNIGDAEMYQVSYIDRAQFRQPVKVHRSRIIPFFGNRVPAIMTQYFDGWGDSVLSAAYDPIRTKDAISQNIGRMTFESIVDILSVPNLAQKLSTPGQEANLLKRLTTANMIKGINSMMLLDGGDPDATNSGGETFERKEITYSGIKDVVDNGRADAAGCDGIPVSRLFGTSATGLNANGESELAVYDQRILRDQGVNLTGPFDQVIPGLIRSLTGETIPYAFKHVPFRTMTEKQRSDIEYQDAQRDQIYDNMGAITPGLVARELDARGTYQTMTDDDIAAATNLPDDNADDPQDDPTDSGNGDPATPPEA